MGMLEGIPDSSSFGSVGVLPFPLEHPITSIMSIISVMIAAVLKYNIAYLPRHNELGEY